MTHDQCEVSEIETILNKLLCNDCFSGNSDEIKISDLLIRRKELLNKLFVCSEENIERLCEISNLLHLKREMLMDEFKRTCRKLLEVCDMQKDTHLTKFCVETSLKIQIGNSHYELWQKNSEGKGNDLDMSELLCAYKNTHDYGNLALHSLFYYDSDIHPSMKEMSDEDLYEYSGLDYEERGLFEYKRIEFLEMHPGLTNIHWNTTMQDLIFDSFYSLEDIIRFNKIESEIRIVYHD